MKTVARRMVLAGVAALVIMAVAVAVYWTQSRPVPLAQRFRTEVLARGDVTQTVSANGTLNPVVLVNVGTQVSGTVLALHADYNDHVRKGQVLLELDPTLLRAQMHISEANLASAQTALAYAQAAEARQRRLLAEQSTAQQDYDQALQALRAAQAQVGQARAALERDRSNLAYATITSPVSGVIIDREVDVGQTVAASFQTPTLFRIAQDLRKMQIDSSFAEADIGGIRVGQPVHFTVDAFANRSFEGRVRQIRINPTTQQNVVTYDVVVSVNNPEEILLPGMTAYVNVVVAERQGVLLVPNAALRFKPAADVPLTKGPAGARLPGPRAVVYKVSGKTLVAVPLETGIADSRYTEVLRGDLQAGDRVVTEDLQAAKTAPASTVRMRMF